MDRWKVDSSFSGYVRLIPATELELTIIRSSIFLSISHTPESSLLRLLSRTIRAGQGDGKGSIPCGNEDAE